jgi:RNA polymerase sigma factor (sigma-70 family)
VVTQEQLATAIMKLRPVLRTVFVMAHVQGKSQEEIAEALGVTQRRVEKRMTKALRTCREWLLAEGLMD